MATPTHSFFTPQKPLFDPFYPLKRWIDSVEIKQANIAHTICRLIPCACPFERDIVLLGRTWFHIPPLCKLNPLYSEFVTLRLKALTYLSDVCGEDVNKYIC